MNVTVEQLGPCKALIKVEVDAAEVDQAFDKAAVDFQKEARLTGFRPGKAPLYLVTRSFGAEIEKEVKRRLLNDNYRKALQEHKLSPMGSTEVEEIQFGRGKSYQFAITVETEPQFELPEYKGIAVQVEARTVTPDDVERALQRLREQHGEFQTVARAAGTGDFLVVNYTGSCEGKPITDHSPTARGLTEQKGFWMRVEEDHFIPGFMPQLIGASAGEKRTVTVTFPTDFVVPVLVGKQGVFEVEVVEVKERLLPELNEEFAQKFGVKDVEALREGVQGTLAQELKNQRVTAIRNQLIQALLGRVTCELPESVVESQTRNVARDIVYQNQQRGVSKEAIQEHKDEIFTSAKSSAKDRVKAALILTKIGAKENIQVNEQEVIQRVIQIAQQSQQKPEKVFKEFKADGRLQAIAEQILTSKVLDFLELNALISEVPVAPGAPASA